MIQSMTGFGSGSFSREGLFVKCEIFCLNRKNLEIAVNLSRNYLFAELDLRKIIEKRLRRGKVSVNFDVKYLNNRKKIVLDESLLDSWQKQLKKISSKYKYSDDIGLSALINTENLWTVTEEEPDRNLILSVLQKSLERAVTKLVDMRTKEGRELYRDITGRICRMEKSLKMIKKRYPVVLKKYSDKIGLRVKKSTEFNVQEKDLFSKFISVFTDKTDITEELVRLESHIGQFSHFLKSREPSGRSMEFLVQECLRETNTIGSKAQDIVITKKVVEIKTLIEQIREQIQNVL